MTAGVLEPLRGFVVIVVVMLADGVIEVGVGALEPLRGLVGRIVSLLVVCIVEVGVDEFEPLVGFVILMEVLLEELLIAVNLSAVCFSWSKSFLFSSSAFKYFVCAKASSFLVSCNAVIICATSECNINYKNIQEGEEMIPLFCLLISTPHLSHIFARGFLGAPHSMHIFAIYKLVCFKKNTLRSLPCVGLAAC